MIKSTKRGFTLIELLVVIAIIGILSSVVIASMNSARKKSRDARRISDISNIKTALEMFYDANQTYPISQAALYTATTGLAPTYIPKVPTDPVGAVEYVYYAVGCAAVTPTGPCTGYRLGAVLEDGTNPALRGDADSTVAGGAASVSAIQNFDGTSVGAAGVCVATAGDDRDSAGAGTETCYDTTP